MWALPTLMAMQPTCQGKGPQGYTLGLYDTQVWKNGQYLDLSLKGSRYENEFGYTGLGRFIDGQSNDSTGFSFGAEIWLQEKDEKGWFGSRRPRLSWDTSE